MNEDHTPHQPAHLYVADDVAAAIEAGRPVVALESTLISHGLPRPDNIVVARQVEATVRRQGAVPATIGVLDGRVIVGLDDAQLEHLATSDEVIKVSLRDLAPAVAAGRTGATTVASTAAVAARVGISVFATGGLGGVHRGARETWDESADLLALAATPVTVVCSGVKSILDVAATLERIESLSIDLVGYRTSRFPGFYLTDSGFPVPWQVDSAEEVADLMRVRHDLALRPGALIVANPLPPGKQVDPAMHERVLAEALAAAAAGGVTGKDVTPYLLAHFHRSTQGQSMEANVAIILGNAALGADIAVAAGRR
ncbi:MAG: pseudouridine-5'-phosphate glycosidase [Mycobacteriales bacterium]